jgi:hypothetical protein
MVLERSLSRMSRLSAEINVYFSPSMWSVTGAEPSRCCKYCRSSSRWSEMLTGPCGVVLVMVKSMGLH